MYSAAVYLIDSTHKLIPYSTNNEPRLSLVFSVICIVLKTIDMFFDNVDECQRLFHKIGFTIGGCAENPFGEIFGGGATRVYAEFRYLSYEFKVIRRICRFRCLIYEIF